MRPQKSEGDCLLQEAQKGLAAFLRLSIALIFASISHMSIAGENPLIEWHSTDVQLLHGDGFKAGPPERTIITLQHANRWRYGDNFLFYDKTFDGDDYFEWHPRLSLSRISGKSLSIGPIKDVFLAGTLEVPQTGSERYLGGVGLDWNVPSFNFVKTNFYIRDNPALSGTTWGTTFSWKKKFSIGAQPFLFDGFVDMAGAEGDRSAYQLAVPALLADIGTHMGYKDRLYLGTEYQYWHNKFGLKGVNESVAQIELRWIIK